MKLPSLFNKKRWLPLGTDMATGEPLALALSRLATHLVIWGPPNSGKTRFLLWIFQQLCKILQATIIVFNPKGDLCHMCMSWAIGHGLTKRLVWFDPGETDPVVGYNPMRPNSLPEATHAKAVREAVRSAWGQASFDQTAQLARYLYITLYAVRELCLTLVEAVSVLRPESSVRQAIIPRIKDPYIRESLLYLDSLKAQRQDELTASTLARLEAFVLDPGIRMVISQQIHSLDLAEVIADHKILLVNLEEYRPLRPDDVRLLGRLLINDIVAHVFNRPSHLRTPVYLVLDEVQTFATHDLCRSLDKGRELGLHVICAHQYLDQLAQEEESGLLLHSVLKCITNKILFGNLSTQDLEILVPEIAIDQFDPWRIKDEITSLELDPIETTRTTLTQGGSLTESDSRSVEHSYAKSYTTTEGQDESYGESEGESEERGVSEGRGLAETLTHGTSRTRGKVRTTGSAASSGFGSGFTDFSSAGETIIIDSSGGLLGGQTASSSQAGSGSSSSNFDSSTTSESESDVEAEAVSQSKGRSWSKNQTLQRSSGQNRGRSRSRGQSFSQSQGEQFGESRGQTKGTSRGKNWNKSIGPWYEYKKRRVVTSRTFLAEREQLLMILQKIKSLPKAHFALKVPNQPLTYVRAPWVADPWITTKTRTRALERIYHQSYYSSRAEIEAEERERLMLLAPTNGNQCSDGGADDPIAGPSIKLKRTRKRT